ncbi:alpha/beta fold hydrolase [Nocardioides silvaticus]|uniref:alpha/beta fold hydrolase n=1 Tax=Nocardioides silvaticus TaxID=2201891 RepID=UPI001B85CEF4|nr:alpha/beta hydrolase [Nocardioides silvaticus]
MPTIDVNGIATYYEVHGAGTPVLLLHGGFCSIETLSAQVAHLAPSYEVHAPERPGQGRTPDRDGPITFEDMVSDTLGYLDAVGVRAAHVIGFSDGAITGLLLARDHADRVLSLVAISGNLDPTGFVEDDVEHDSGLDPDRFSEAYDRLSPDGPEHREAVLEKLMAMWTTQPQIAASSLSAITAPTLVLAGQHDSIRTDHTVAIADAIPGAQLAIVPGAGHTVMEERPEVVNLLVAEFLSSLGA